MTVLLALAPAFLKEALAFFSTALGQVALALVALLLAYGVAHHRGYAEGAAACRAHYAAATARLDAEAAAIEAAKAAELLAALDAAAQGRARAESALATQLSRFEEEKHEPVASGKNCPPPVYRPGDVDRVRRLRAGPPLR